MHFFKGGTTCEGTGDTGDMFAKKNSYGSGLSQQMLSLQENKRQQQNKKKNPPLFSSNPWRQLDQKMF